MGGGGGGDTQVIQPPIREDTPLQQGLISRSTQQMNAAIPFDPYGAGYQLMPLAPMGQVYMPGPNQTMIGNAFNPNNLTPFFGQSAQAPTNFGMGGSGASGGGTTGGAGGGGGAMSPMMQLLQTYYSALRPPTGYGGGAQSPPTPFGQGMPGQLPQQPQGNFAYLPGTQQQQPQLPAPAAPSQQARAQAPSQPAQPAKPPSGKDAPDPWAGTNNARTQNNPGTNWNPDGTYNANGPYYQAPPVGPQMVAQQPNLVNTPVLGTQTAAQAALPSPTQALAQQFAQQGRVM